MTAGSLLHARSRGLYPSWTALVIIALAAPLSARPMASAMPEEAASNVLTLMIVAIGAGVALAANGLAGVVPDLEGSTPRAGLARLRLAHLAIAITGIAGAVILGFLLLGPLPEAGLKRPDVALIIVRDTAGMIGLLALTASVVGARFSWWPSTLWTLVLVTSPMAAEQGWRLAASMPRLPPDQRMGTFVAVLLLVVGSGAYTARRTLR